MGFMGTTVGVGDAVGAFLDGEQAVGFEDAAFAVDPGGLDGVEPWTLDWQVAGDDADAVTRLLDLAVVVSDPVTDEVADVPGGVVPDQEQRLLAVGVELAAAPVEVVDGDGADRPAIDEPQPHPVGGVPVTRVGTQQQAVTGQRLGVRVVLRDRLFNQPQALICLDPGVQAGASQTAPPDLILEAQGPGRMRRGQPYQTVARTFLSKWVPPTFIRQGGLWPMSYFFVRTRDRDW